MFKSRYFLLLAVLCYGSAAADIWKWVDAAGNVHLVDTNTPIYTWVDDDKTFYSDTPDHEDAVLVQLVWHSKGTLKNVPDEVETSETDNGYAYDGETDQQRLAREADEAHYCKRATEIYDSYKNAPRLYRTNEAGEREYLSKAEEKATLDETKAKVDDLCG